MGVAVQDPSGRVRPQGSGPGVVSASLQTVWSGNVCLMANRRAAGQGDRDRRPRVWARQYGTLNPAGAVPGIVSLVNQYELDMGADYPEGVTFGGAWLQLSLARTAGTADSTPAVIAGVRIGTRMEDDIDVPPADLAVGGMHQDWIWWHKLYLVGDGASPATTWRRSFDFELGSQRRIPTNQHVPLLAVQLPSAGADTYALSYASSVLLILP